MAEWDASGEGCGYQYVSAGKVPPTVLFEQEGGDMTVTGQCASHTLPHLHLLPPHEQYRVACIPHATLFPFSLVHMMSPPVPMQVHLQ